MTREMEEERNEDLRAERDRVLTAALTHVPFDGWSMPSLRAALRDLGLPATDAARLFPGGVIDLVDWYSDWADRAMLRELESRGVGALKVRERIALAVRTRLEVCAADRESVRRALSFLSLPANAPTALRGTWRTVNAIWQAAGDSSTDYNFYTKRGSLAGIYGATVLYWLADESEGQQETWGFLDRRIDDLLKVMAPKRKGGRRRPGGLGARMAAWRATR